MHENTAPARPQNWNHGGDHQDGNNQLQVHGGVHGTLALTPKKNGRANNKECPHRAVLLLQLNRVALCIRIKFAL
jgi:hypothetical protein